MPPAEVRKVKFRIRNLKRPRNIVGPRVRQLRTERGWSQPMLVAKLNLLGWDISRETLAKIEAQIHWVADAELLCLAHSLDEPVQQLLPSGKDSARVFKSFFRVANPG